MAGGSAALAERKPEQDAKGRFLPGNNGGPGRPKGSRSLLGEAFLEAMYADFQINGVAAIQTVREGKPDQYLKVVASILPKEIEAGERLGNILEDVLARVDGRTREVKPTFEIVG